MAGTQVKYIGLSGGLDLIHSPIVMEDGRLTECSNFEQVFGRQGYRRIDGYERFDGHVEPHNADYYIVEFDTGTAAISVGDIITGPDATGDVLLVELTSGSWVGGNAVGRLIAGNMTGTFSDHDNIQVSAATKAKANGASYKGSISETLNTTYLALAREDRRTAISKVPGEGQILGVAVFGNAVYAVRNIVGSTSATMFKSSASGWTSIKTGLYPGGAYRMIGANFSGDSRQVYLFGCDGKNRSFRYDGTTWTWMPPIYGSQATSTTSLVIGTGAKAFTCVETLRSFVTGQTFIAHSISNAANRMTGTFTSYAANVLTINVTSVVGSGTITDWEIGLSDFSDKPFELVAHKDHLFLAYPNGQLQTSNLGDPMLYTSTASLFGMGDEISGLIPLKGDSLAIYCRNKTDLLTGSDKTSWQKSPFSTSAGAVFLTAQNFADIGMALDERGLTSLQATQVYGSFEMSVFSRDVKALLDAKLSLVVASRVIRSKGHYRMYFSDGTVLTCCVVTPNAVIQPKDVSFTDSTYLNAPVVVASGEILGEDYLLFGTSDGYVMREDVGPSFDGEAIEAVMRTPFINFRLPANKKRFRKLVMETESQQLTQIYFRQQFDYSDGNYRPSIQYDNQSLGGGGAWNVGEWDGFLWSLPLQTQTETNIDGVGRNMSLLIWSSSALDDAFYIQGLLIHYSILGLTR